MENASEYGEISAVLSIFTNVATRRRNRLRNFSKSKALLNRNNVYKNVYMDIKIHNYRYICEYIIIVYIFCNL